MLIGWRIAKQLGIATNNRQRLNVWSASASAPQGWSRKSVRASSIAGNSKREMNAG
jgi:hypothetical protein